MTVVCAHSPQLEMAAHAQQNGFFGDLGGVAQFRRNQHTARAVHVHIHGIAQKDTFPPMRGHRQSCHALAKFLPFTAWEQHQASVRVAGDGELPGRGRTQHVTVPGGHR